MTNATFKLRQLVRVKNEASCSDDNTITYIASYIPDVDGGVQLAEPIAGGRGWNIEHLEAVGDGRTWFRTGAFELANKFEFTEGLYSGRDTLFASDEGHVIRINEFDTYEFETAFERFCFQTLEEAIQAFEEEIRKELEGDNEGEEETSELPETWVRYSVEEATSNFEFLEDLDFGDDVAAFLIREDALTVEELKDGNFRTSFYAQTETFRTRDAAILYAERQAYGEWGADYSDGKNSPEDRIAKARIEYAGRISDDESPIPFEQVANKDLSEEVRLKPWGTYTKDLQSDLNEAFSEIERAKLAAIPPEAATAKPAEYKIPEEHFDNRIYKIDCPVGPEFGAQRDAYLKAGFFVKVDFKNDDMFVCFPKAGLELGDFPAKYEIA